jgi:hypothetical protein
VVDGSTYGVAVSDDRSLDSADASAVPDAPAGAAATGDTETAPVGPHPVLVYTLKRFALLVAVGAILYLVGLRQVWLILFAFLISGVIAAVVLNRSREGASYGITSAISRVNARIDASARAEDIDDLDDVAPVEPGRDPD